MSAPQLPTSPSAFVYYIYGLRAGDRGADALTGVQRGETDEGAECRMAAVRSALDMAAWAVA